MGAAKKRRKAGSELLKGWLEENEVSYAQFAKMADCCKATVGHLRNGHLRPGLDLAVRIERVTKGDVPATSWSS